MMDRQKSFGPFVPLASSRPASSLDQHSLGAAFRRGLSLAGGLPPSLAARRRTLHLLITSAHAAWLRQRETQRYGDHYRTVLFRDLARGRARLAARRRIRFPLLLTAGCTPKESEGGTSSTGAAPPASGG